MGVLLHKQQVLDSVQELIESGRAQGKSMVTSLVQVQLAWLNTSHPNFVGGSRAVLQAMTRLQEEKQKERDRQALLRARTLGVFGRGEVENVLEGDAQGYGSLAHTNKPKKKGWFWNKDRKEHNGDDGGGGGGSSGAGAGGGEDGQGGEYDEEDEDDGFSEDDDDDDDDYDDSPEGEALRMRNAAARRHRSDRRRAKAAAAADAQRHASSSSQGGRGYGRGGPNNIGHASIHNPNGGWRVADATAVNLEPMPARVVRDYAIKNEKETIEVRCAAPALAAARSVATHLRTLLTNLFASYFLSTNHSSTCYCYKMTAFTFYLLTLVFPLFLLYMRLSCVYTSMWLSCVIHGGVANEGGNGEEVGGVVLQRGPQAACRPSAQDGDCLPGQRRSARPPIRTRACQCCARDLFRTY